LQSTRAMLRGHTVGGQDVIEFAVPHTLAFTFFPAWVSSTARKFGPIKSRLIALNVHDAVMRMVEGSCDLLIAYHHPSQPFQLDADRYEMVSLGEEVLAPYVKPASNGAPLYQLPGRRASHCPTWAMHPGAYLGQMTELILKQSSTAIHFDRVYETDMAEGLKVMALEGHGIAFLPHSAVKKELRAKRLVSALPPDTRGWTSPWMCASTGKNRFSRNFSGVHMRSRGVWCPAPKAVPRRSGIFCSRGLAHRPSWRFLMQS
jgi:DNA-binding transcriptional LysR family regulator